MKTISIDKFKGLKVEANFKEIMDKHADKGKNILFSTSPKSGRAGRATPYYQGWTVDVYPRKDRYALQIWNKTNWQLTHLLENGHFVTNLDTGLTWVQPRKHIYPAYLKIRTPFIRDMKNAKLKVDFK